MVAEFIASCERLGVLSVVEAIVRRPSTGDPDWDHRAAVVAAARECGDLGPDLYKAEAPTLGAGSEAEIEDGCAQITQNLSCPWVVLSGGVAAERFLAVVASACRGGASGFLAGRGIWGPSIAADDPTVALTMDAQPRMLELSAVVDATARPWQALG